MKGVRLFLLLAGIIFLANSNFTFSQSIPDSTNKKLDSLFVKWNTSSSPGCAVGIVRNDSLIYSKGFGLANLEYGIPISPQTVFHVASVSKQFTAWSVILLARQGKLKLDDDIRKWLPWFPDLKTKITIQHLLNHTSGIRDQWQLLAIAGTRLDDVITQEQIIKMLTKQQALNFSPGEKHTYCNSGYTMLAEIVKSVSGQTLRKFTDSSIFKPLGMINTHFHDDYTEIEKNRAYSYGRTDSIHFSNSVLSYSNAGATSLFTTVTDMSKWLMNFYTHKSGDQLDVDLLTKKGKLNSGKYLSYANGIVAGEYKGWKEFSHGGADAGYRSYVTVIPGVKMGFVVFSNLGDFNAGGKAYEMAELFVKDSTHPRKEVKKETRDSTTALLKDTVSLQKFLGYYISDDGLPVHFDIIKNRLYFHVYDQNNFLIRDSADQYSIADAPEVKFAFSINGKDTITDISTPGESYHLLKYRRDTTQADKLLATFTGTYYSPELDCRYGIVLKDHHLFLTHSKYNDTKLTLVNNDHLTSDYWWINHIKMLRNSKNEITGFEINSGRVMHVKFDKIMGD
jgi:CubicO group peptidase (beta-lactamase class C family)